MNDDARAEPSTRTGRNWLRLALWLVGGAAAYNLIEGVIALWAGFSAASVSLVGFGLDSFIELAAASVVLWRMAREAAGAASEDLERTEHRVHRFVGLTFIALALYFALEAASTLLAREPPHASLVGIVLAAASLVIMPAVARGKLRAAERIRNGALRAEAKETLACSDLSFVLLLGLGANALAGWWWADSAAALLMIPWLAREGIEGLEH